MFQLFEQWMVMSGMLYSILKIQNQSSHSSANIFTIIPIPKYEKTKEIFSKKDRLAFLTPNEEILIRYGCVKDDELMR